MHVSIVETGHDEAVLEIVGDETVGFSSGFDFIVASYDGEEAGWRNDKRFGPGMLRVYGEDAAVNVGCAVVTWSFSGA